MTVGCQDFRLGLAWVPVILISGQLLRRTECSFVGRKALMDVIGFTMHPLTKIYNIHGDLPVFVSVGFLGPSDPFLGCTTNQLVRKLTILFIVI